MKKRIVGMCGTAEEMLCRIDNMAGELRNNGCMNINIVMGADSFSMLNRYFGNKRLDDYVYKDMPIWIQPTLETGKVIVEGEEMVEIKPVEIKRWLGVSPLIDERPRIESIFYNEKKNATTVLWSDGTHTVVKKSKGTKHDIYSAVAAATAIKVYGNNTRFKKIIEDKLVVMK